MLLGLTSFLAILVIYILALWHDQWLFSVGRLLVFTGYIGIVMAVMLAALLIHSSCACIQLESRSVSNLKQLTDGLVVSVKSTDSGDTRGSKLMTSRCRAQHLELVWMRDLTRRRKILASGTAMSLVLFFLSVTISSSDQRIGGLRCRITSMSACRRRWICHEVSSTEVWPRRAGVDRQEVHICGYYTDSEMSNNGALR